MKQTKNNNINKKLYPGNDFFIEKKDMKAEPKKTLTQKTIAKAKSRGWKSVIGAALNTAGVPLLTFGDVYFKIAGVVCLAVGSAFLAWDEKEEPKEPAGYTAFKEKELTRLIHTNMEKKK